MRHYGQIYIDGAWVDPVVKKSTPVVNPATEEVMKHYGALKAACEVEVRAAFGNSAIIVRPGLIVGPHDSTDRFGYWVARFRHAGGGGFPRHRSRLGCKGGSRCQKTGLSSPDSGHRTPSPSAWFAPRSTVRAPPRRRGRHRSRGSGQSL